MADEYNVNEYTDEQLFRILDLNNPSDRELEAKILSMVRKYSNFGNASGDKLSQFFIDIYNRFFENTEDYGDSESSNYDIDESNANNSGEELKEGFEIQSDDAKKGFLENVKSENILSAASNLNPENGVKIWCRV